MSVNESYPKSKSFRETLNKSDRIESTAVFLNVSFHKLGSSSRQVVTRVVPSGEKMAVRGAVSEASIIIEIGTPHL